MGSGRWDAAALARVAGQIAEGVSIAEIARLNGISKQAMYLACKTHGVALPRRGQYPAFMGFNLTPDQRARLKRVANTRRVSEGAVLRGLIDGMEVEE